MGLECERYFLFSYLQKIVDEPLHEDYDKEHDNLQSRFLLLVDVLADDQVGVECDRHNGWEQRDLNLERQT